MAYPFLCEMFFDLPKSKDLENQTNIEKNDAAILKEVFRTTRQNKIRKIFNSFVGEVENLKNKVLHRLKSIFFSLPSL